MIINSPIVNNGVKLPKLSKPASAANIENSYQAINALGEIITGTLSKGINSVTLYNKNESNNNYYTVPTSGTFIVLTLIYNAKGGNCSIVKDGVLIYDCLDWFNGRYGKFGDAAGQFYYNQYCKWYAIQVT